MSKSKTVVFVHGLFVNANSWSEWKVFFEAKGYTCHTPHNPYHEGNPATLRANIPAGLPTLGFEEAVMNIVALIDKLPEKPIVIGHSLAGLVIQKLVELGKATAGVSIDGAPPKNVMPGLTTVFAVTPVVNPFAGNSPYMGTREWYHKRFFNTMTRADSDKAYDQIACPESRKIARETLLKPFANVDHSKPHAPLLFIGGESDTIFPAAFTKRNAAAYKDKNSITDFKSFPGRSHFLCGQEGWQEIAEYVSEWVGKNG